MLELYFGIRIWVLPFFQFPLYRWDLLEGYMQLAAALGSCGVGTLGEMRNL